MSVMPKSPAKTGTREPIAAEIFLQALSEHGVDYCFINPGTDFPPIVEAYVRGKKPTPSCRSPSWCRMKI
jgi:hypothetical protein